MHMCHDHDSDCGGSNVLYARDLHFADICDLRRMKPSPLSVPHNDNLEDARINTAVGVVLMYASWNRQRVHAGCYANEQNFLSQCTQELSYGLENCQSFCAAVQVDRDDDSVSLCLGETCASQSLIPLPPTEFPALALVFQQSDMDHAVIRYVKHLSVHSLITALKEPNPLHNGSVLRACQNVMQTLETDFDLAVTPESCQDALRIFVAGDKSSVGKSSICLGLLGTLLQSFESHELAYIKPATQNEATPLIQLYCAQHRIDAVPVGPLVYYRGFTRAFLAGQTAPSSHLLQTCGRAVDRLARRKKIVLIDGVGFPAVGSVCGTDNARVARACGYPVPPKRSVDFDANNDYKSAVDSRAPMGVILVGGSGVGAAVDAFNLNAVYFEKYQVPVMGAIFNKLSETGYYSLENCKKEVTAYFETQDTQNRQPFGFVPLFPNLGSSTVTDSNKVVTEHVDAFVSVFAKHVDIAAILKASQEIKDKELASLLLPKKEAIPCIIREPVVVKSDDTSSTLLPNLKRRKIKTSFERPVLLAREEIERAAILGGATPSA